MRKSSRYLVIAAAFLAGGSLSALAQTTTGVGGAAVVPGATIGGVGVTGFGTGTAGIGALPGGQGIGSVPGNQGIGSAGYSSAYSGWTPGAAGPGAAFRGSTLGGIGPAFGSPALGSTGVPGQNASVVPNVNNGFSRFPSTTVGVGGTVAGIDTTGGIGSTTTGFGGTTAPFGGMATGAGGTIP